MKVLFVEDYGENTPFPPCGHDGGGKMGMISIASCRKGQWKCAICGCEVVRLGTMEGQADTAGEGFSEGAIVKVSFEDGESVLYYVVDT